jgi:hypothetical protein
MRKNYTLLAVASRVIDVNRSPFKVVQQRNGSGAITTSYTFNAFRLATWNGSAVSYELTDRLGSVRMLADTSGNVSQIVNYEVFVSAR